MKKILVTRTDRIGDVVLSTPVLKSLKRSFPSMFISVLVRKYTRDIVTDNPCVDEVIIFEPEGRHRTINGILRLAEEIKGKKFDAALLLFLDFKIGLLSFLSRIPQRIGPATKLAQIFLTHTLPQHRSKVDRHEVDYNLEMAEVLGAKPIRQSEIYIPDEVTKRVNDIFSELRAPIVGIQPGSGVSARNWRPERYGELANKIIDKTNAVIFVTGGPGEEGLVDEVINSIKWKTSPSSPGKVFKYIGYGGIKELSAIIKRFNVMVGPSTGPIHIASAVGTPVVSLYCPIFVCQPKRWGPIGENDIALTPDVPFCKKCIFERCKYYDCMDRIDIDRVFDEVSKRLWVR
ncbi:MAG: glycosyltransferase family 9 protein [Nitrospinae bacterium]|nr:glycosyltransferase family 9 protein [Nitrospinota bacterium]